MTRAEFLEAHPGIFFLDLDAPGLLQDYLHRTAVLPEGETVIAVAKAGDGNMNCTLRATTSAKRRLIVKQARPWVEKYPQFAAPWDRALREMQFYELAGSDARLCTLLPNIVHTDVEDRLLVMEDLGDDGDCSDVYAGGVLRKDEVARLAKFLSQLHSKFQGSSVVIELDNRGMRELNHAHIFDIPFVEDNGLDLDGVLPGLSGVAREIRAERELIEQIRELGGSVYLADASDFADTACLLHGDFFPGSFLRTNDGLRVIDPEFCFGGRPEFDSGVFLAHLVLGQQAPSLAQCWFDLYQPPSGHDETLMLQMAGVEIIRRLLGYAQLPLDADLQQRKAMLTIARALVLAPRRDLLLS